ncbi:MAG: phosphate transport system regulatory protein PhoU [Deltaproteobacteria bacterium RIFCSPLOWO2_02_FULL_50_16]|nr:MAG: phosphate transport system regulatory protein PhoU [Deltaproteobacteria bacterium RIFCSPLOWO2_02_FULL_50_16]OGQ67467.1 MAG: phosphate transport system regulatory protein PhoU [Deltaproteobacteria bacterium RIFCSPLOWO2_12_FULL_50_11]
MEHTDKYYEQELKGLKEVILKMGGLVEEMITLSLKSLTERDTDPGEAIDQREREVNSLEIDIDDRCLQMLALRQPTASDLRFITIGLKIGKDLERIGDLAINIYEQAQELNHEPPLKPYIDLPLLATKTQAMVKKALDAFVNQEAGHAQEVCAMDDEADDLNQKIFQDLVGLMQKNPEAVLRGTRLITCAKHLERMADHATNIAEQVIFMVQGRDIRHGRSL